MADMDEMSKPKLLRGERGWWLLVSQIPALHRVVLEWVSHGKDRTHSMPPRVAMMATK